MRRKVAGLDALEAEVVRCRACPRLVSWREEVARTRRRAFRDWEYWGRPVAGFGDSKAGLLVVGLAPAAHGANRTGRMFTGDRSGDFLYAALHRAGFANQPRSVHREDGLVLRGAFVTNAARCAPPDNRPLPEELARCAPYLDRELLLIRPKVILALGAIAWTASLNALERLGAAPLRPQPKFGHGAEVRLEHEKRPRSRSAPPLPAVLASYHVSQQNTQTGRLTPRMFDAVLVRAKQLLASERSS